MEGPLFQDNSLEVALFALAVFAGFLALVAVSLFTLWLQRKREAGALSPYTNTRVRKGSELSYGMALKVLTYLYKMHQYDNRIFELRHAVVCRETGRIFPDCIDRFGLIHLDWTFLKKRYRGTFVSWGSLSDDQQKAIREAHDSLEGFQTEESSPNPIPRLVERRYAYTVPGPLYVDLETKVLLGWKCVPETELEVLIVQKPIQVHIVTVPDDEEIK